MKRAISLFCLLSLSLSAAYGQQQSQDPNFAFKGPATVDHPGVGVLSFLSGHWLGKSATGGLIDLLWSPIHDNSIIGVRKYVDDKNRVNLEEIVLQDAGHGAAGWYHVATFPLTCEQGLNQLGGGLHDYDERSADLVFVRDRNSELKLTFKKVSPDTLILDREELDTNGSPTHEITTFNRDTETK